MTLPTLSPDPDMLHEERIRSDPRVMSPAELLEHAKRMGEKRAEQNRKIRARKVYGEIVAELIRRLSTG